MHIAHAAFVKALELKFQKSLIIQFVERFVKFPQKSLIFDPHNFIST